MRCNCTQNRPDLHGHHPKCHLSDRTLSSIAQRLAETRTKVEHRERMLRGAKRDRDLLVLKLAKAGVPERTIAPIAGVSNIRVNQVKREGIEGWRARYGVEQ